ncbi:MAG: thymidine phosphorylase [Lachnospiraceae bacterium]|nr:thymidine phosphorylase [Lachnospiraceae bacterium]
MRMVDIIHKKRMGEALTEDEIRFVVNGTTDGSIPDYQLTALCMAIVFQSMNDEETALLTRYMAESGDQIDLSEFGDLSVDKHSTGGVGDKTTLILAPLVAACGGIVAKMSGRGLGHTGGTIDKLESIPGFQTKETIGMFLKQSREVGVTVVGQTKELAPADRRLYVLRDVTATVEAIPLIVSSIMSKKLAAGAHSIVLDVTVGSGAFMKTVEEATVLAEKMVTIGRACGRNMSALITNMDEPLGHAVGNALVVQEAIGVLKGEVQGDLKEVCLALAGEMLSLCLKIPPEKGRAMAEETLESGAAYKKFKEWITAQGGDVRFAEDPSLFPEAAFSRVIRSPKSGYIEKMNAERIGNVAGQLGAGRRQKGDDIDFAAGIYLYAKTGDHVKKGEPLAKLFTEHEESLDDAEAAYLDALSWSRKRPEPEPIVYKIIH